MNKVASYPRWAVFQAAALLVLVTCAVVAVPCFVAIWKPESMLRVDATLEESTNSDAAKLLPKEGASADERLNASLDLQKYYNQKLHSKQYLSAVLEAFFIRGLIDLNVSAVMLDPTRQTMLLSVVGQPYGNIVFTGNRDLIALSFPPSADSKAVLPTATTPVPSCALPIGGASWGCADLNLAIGTDMLSYSTGDAIQRSITAIDVRPDDSLDNYPFDTYTAFGSVKASVSLQVSSYHYLAMIEKAALADEKADKSEVKEIVKAIGDRIDEITTNGGDGMRSVTWQAWQGNQQIDLRMTLAPYLQGWAVKGKPQLEAQGYELDADTLRITYEDFVSLLTTNSTREPTVSNQVVLQYTITYERSTFTKLFAVSIVVCMWVLSVYLFVLAVDHVIVRRRELMGDTVGFAVGMLFALPALRMLLEAPLGSYIDFLGFMWNMLLVAFAVVIYFTGAYINHKHTGVFFKKSTHGVTEVLLHASFAERVQQSVDGAILSRSSFAQDLKDLNASYAGKESV